jgi:hypothetical protein
MAVSWPGALPQQPGDYSEQKQPVTIRTQPDEGPSKSRRRFTKALTKGKMGFLLTNEQAVILDDFWTNQCQSGAVKCLFRHPWRGTMLEMIFPDAPDMTSDGPLTVKVNLNVEYL